MYTGIPDSVIVRTITALKPVIGSALSSVDIVGGGEGGGGGGGKGDWEANEGAIGPATLGAVADKHHTLIYIEELPTQSE